MFGVGVETKTHIVVPTSRFNRRRNGHGLNFNESKQFNESKMQRMQNQKIQRIKTIPTVMV